MGHTCCIIDEPLHKIHSRTLVKHENIGCIVLDVLLLLARGLNGGWSNAQDGTSGGFGKW